MSFAVMVLLGLVKVTQTQNVPPQAMPMPQQPLAPVMDNIVRSQPSTIILRPKTSELRLPLPHSSQGKRSLMMPLSRRKLF